MVIRKTRCRSCQGSGKVMGGGMILQDCEDCDGRGKIAYENFYDDLKNTPEYDKAIEKISSSEHVTKDEAKEIFKEEFDKLEPKKRGRPRAKSSG